MNNCGLGTASVLKITQQDPARSRILLHTSLLFPDLLPWMESDRGLSPSQGTLQLLIELSFLERHIPTTLWLFCIFPSARGIEPDCLNVVMSPPGAAQRPLGLLGMGLLEAARGWAQPAADAHGDGACQKS